MCVCQSEEIIPWTPQNPLEDHTEQLCPQSPRIHVILRALGFRSQHRVFLTEFRLHM